MIIQGHNGTNPQIIVIDATTRAQTTIAYAHHEIHAGNHFNVVNFVSLTTGTNIDFLWVVPNTTKWPHALWNIDSEFEVTMSLYEAVTTSANGAAVPIRNNNRNSATAAGVTAFSGPTLASGALGDGAVGGTLVWAQKIGSGKKIGGAGQRNHEFIGKQNTKYWFRIANASGSTSWINYDFNWYEHTNLET